MPVHVVHANVVRPRERIEPEQLLRSWPTLPDIATAVQRAGAEVTVLQCFHRDAELLASGVRYLFVREPGLPRKLAGLAPWRLASAAKAVSSDIIHLNGFEFAAHARLLCGLGIPVLVQDHASSLQMRFPARRSWGYRRISAAAFTSAAQGANFLAGAGLPKHTSLFEIPESSTHFTPGDQHSARLATGLSGDPAALWVGRLNSNKDPLTILAAAGLALRALPGLQLWCCFTEDDLLPAVTGFLAANPELARHVHLLGKVPHARVELLCRAADFFLIGSKEESTGYALIEALACGATPIVSDIPAFRAVTGNGAVGRLVPRGDAAAFAKALVDLAEGDPSQLRAAALEHFAKSLSFDVVGAKLVDAYRSILAAGDAR
ncbi:MAG TPA: glycosyltransferase family 4 protein [Sphingomicrobium sp.]|nr:glycosyltransferase family 4 protein [Sphingomicrobium sp.]